LRLPLLRQPSKPNAPRPVAKSGKAAGAGVAAGSLNADLLLNPLKLFTVKAVANALGIDRHRGASVQYGPSAVNLNPFILKFATI